MAVGPAPDLSCHLHAAEALRLRRPDFEGEPFEPVGRAARVQGLVDEIEHRRKFSPQFKAEAVQMVIETGKPIAEIARDFGIHDGPLGNWVSAWRHEHPEPDQALTPAERARVKELEDENRRLRMENEFLKKQRPSAMSQSGMDASPLGGCARCWWVVAGTR